MVLSRDCAEALRFPLAVALKPTCQAVKSGGVRTERKLREGCLGKTALNGSPHDLYRLHAKSVPQVL